METQIQGAPSVLCFHKTPEEGAMSTYCKILKLRRETLLRMTCTADALIRKANQVLNVTDKNVFVFIRILIIKRPQSS